MKHFYNKVLIIGKNSRLVKEMIAHNPGVFFKAVSHKDIINGNVNLDDFFCDFIAIFSYSKNKKENQALIDLVCKSKKIILYISTCAVIVVETTPYYLYPNVKKAAEDYGLSNYSNFSVLRLGMFDEGYGNRGLLCVSNIGELVEYLKESSNIGQYKVKNLFKIVDYGYSSALEKLVFDVYNNSSERLGRFAILLRPFDVIANILGYRSYGYTSLSGIKWSSMMR